MLELKNIKYNADSKEELSFSVDGKGIHGICCSDTEEAVLLGELLSGCREPVCGQVCIGGESASAHRAKVGCAFADMPYYTDITVYETLAFIGKAKKIDPDKLSRQIKEAMALVGIERLSNTNIARISEKGRRSLSVAASLLGNPDTLIFVSITDGMDEKTVTELRSTLEMLGTVKCTVLISTDDALLLELCSDIRVVLDGKLLFEGSTEELSEQLTGGKRLSVKLKGSDEEIAMAQTNVQALDGVSGVSADKSTLTVSYDCEMLDRETVLTACESAGCTVRSVSVRAKAVADVFFARNENEEEEE